MIVIFIPYIWDSVWVMISPGNRFNLVQWCAFKGERDRGFTQQLFLNLFLISHCNISVYMPSEYKGCHLVFMKPRAIKALWLDQEEGSETTYHTSLITTHSGQTIISTVYSTRKAYILAKIQITATVITRYKMHWTEQNLTQYQAKRNTHGSQMVDVSSLTNLCNHTQTQALG